MAADEEVDVVDEEDAVIGRATRAEVRARNLRHRAAYVLVFDPGGKLFVHQRSMAKDVYPGYFDVAIGGVVEAGETYDAAAERELGEELGIRGIALRRVVRSRFEDAHNRINGMIYSCTYDGPVTLQTSEIVSGEWLDLDVVFERTQRQSFCPDGIDALVRYLERLESARSRLSS
jgi:isopentenyldiphosphate isomerase